MKPLVVAGMIALIAGQASALSCIQPDPVRAFQQAAGSDVTYYVLYGTLDFEAAKQPKGVVNEPRRPDPIPAFFRGSGLSDSGFDLPFETAVTVQPLCAGSWCGATAPHTPALIFAQVHDDQILVEVGPCGGQVFLEPTVAVLDKMTQCMNGNC